MPPHSNLEMIGEPYLTRLECKIVPADVKALQLNHLGPTVWTLIDADHGRYLRAVDVNITTLNGVVRAHAVQAWYHDKQTSEEVFLTQFPGTWDLTVAEATHACNTMAGTMAIKTASWA